MGMASGKMLMETVMLDNGLRTWRMVMEFTSGKMEIVMKESGIDL